MAMMTRVALILCMVPGIALAGCSAASGPPDLALAQVNTDTPKAAPQPDRTSAPPADSGPFDAEAFYQLLVAEMAGRRGDYALSLDSFLQVARGSKDPAVAERAVRVAVFARDEARGLEAAKLWADFASPNHDARQVYGVLLARAGKVDESMSVLSSLANDRAAQDPAVFGRISNMLAREKSRENAVTVMEAVADQHLDSPDAQYALAQLLFRFGELAKALVVAERVMLLAPDNQRGAIFKAQVLNRQTKQPAAMEVLATFLEGHPDSHEARMAYGRLLVDGKRYDEAREQFLLLSKSQPEDLDVAYALGLLLLQTNDLDLAKAQFTKLVRSAQRRDTAWFYLGQIAEAQDNADEALNAYRKVDRGDHHLNAQIRVAVLLANRGDIIAARRHLHDQRAREQSDSIRLVRAEAEMLGREEMLEEALAVYDKGLTDFPGDSGLLYARAMLSVRLDRIESVEKDLRAILEREPDNADALNALGYTLADRTERYEEAYELIKRAHDLKPEDHYVVDSLGWVLYRLGRYDESVKYLRRAMELQPDPEVAAHLGEVLWVMGDKDGARDVWNSALQAQPDDKRLLEVLKRFGN